MRPSPGAIPAQSVCTSRLQASASEGGGEAPGGGGGGGGSAQADAAMQAVNTAAATVPAEGINNFTRVSPGESRAAQLQCSSCRASVDQSIGERGAGRGARV